jgi:hypothetical protein
MELKSMSQLTKSYSTALYSTSGRFGEIQLLATSQDIVLDVQAQCNGGDGQRRRQYAPAQLPLADARHLRGLLDAAIRAAETAASPPSRLWSNSATATMARAAARADGMTAALSRRITPGSGMTALLASPAAPASVPTGHATDTELMRLCGQLTALNAELDALLERRVTVADEDRTEPDLCRLNDRHAALADALCVLPIPTTLAGARAAARHAVKNQDLLENPHEPAYHLAWLALSFLAGDQDTTSA